MSNMATLITNCVFQCLVCFLQFKSLYSESVHGVETEAFDFDGNPVSRYEFQVQVGAGKEDCFFQKIREGASLRVSYKVLRGSDRNVNVFLRSPNHTIIDSITNAPDGEFNTEAVETGDYSICIDNTFSHFTSKLVYMYLVTYIHSEWAKYVKELADVHMTVSKFQVTINSVEKSIQDVKQYQANAKMNFMMDGYQALKNNRYVQYWAILHCAIFIITSVFQVYFVRRLFRSVNVAPTAKPRA